MDQQGGGRIGVITDLAIAAIVGAMVLALRLPDGGGDSIPGSALVATYSASFMSVAIIWISHRQLLRLVPRGNRRVLMANAVLLGCLTPIPAAIFHLGGNFGASGAMALYAAALMLASGAFALIRGSAMRALRRGARGPGGGAAGKMVMAGAVLYGIAALAALADFDVAVVLIVVATLLFAVPLLGGVGLPRGADGRRRFAGRGGRQEKEERARALAEFEKLIPGGPNDG
ncbi:MAG: TMEM175 family protein [Alphaproteobacteria bacterium]|nr:TMEM175 family protein [Alphaproteobacteria bacterium]